MNIKPPDYKYCPFCGQQFFPAGFIDFAEHPEEALARKVKEEAGLDIKQIGWKIHQQLAETFLK